MYTFLFAVTLVSALPKPERSVLGSRVAGTTRNRSTFPKLFEDAEQYEQKPSRFSWTFGNVRQLRNVRSSDEDPAGYQTDSSGKKIK